MDRKQYILSYHYEGKNANAAQPARKIDFCTRKGLLSGIGCGIV
jgi:hypothetical protein